MMLVRQFALGAGLGLALAALPDRALAEESLRPAEVVTRLVAAYPDFLVGGDATSLHWRDGFRMPLEDGRFQKTDGEAIAAGDVVDMFRWRYPVKEALMAPPAGADPGRARNTAFFKRMYGDCRKGEVEPHLRDVAWLPSKGGQRLRVTGINGVADRLQAVSVDLERLPERFDVFLRPAAGTYACRVIAGTQRPSAHGYGIAIDIALKRADYWRWVKSDASGAKTWRNSVPREIVDVFERHGFIWGGRWHHFDTMHFEYRPELIGASPAARGCKMGERTC